MTVCQGRDFVYGEACERGGGRVGAMGGRRHENPPALFAPRFDGRADRKQSAQLAMRSGFGAHRHGRHARQGRQPAHQFGNERQCTLYSSFRLKRMKITEAGQPRHFFVQPRIVLHRTGAERIEARVDGIIHARQPHEVAHHFRLRQSRQSDGLFSLQTAQPFVRDLCLRNVHATHPLAPQFEQQRLFVIETPIAGEGLRVFHFDGFDACGTSDRVHRHDTTSASACAKASQSSSGLVSVAATIRKSRIFAWCGHRRDPGTPPRIPRAASASTISSAGFGSFSVNSLKNCGVTSDTPLTAASFSASDEARPWLRRASRLNPLSPSSARWIVKARQQRPEFVQILLVAFSRRMCCSRVDSVSTYPRLPSASTVSPESRPGIWRMNFSRVANRPTYGPPKFNPLPIDWPSAATISAPMAPGGSISPSETTSVTTAIRSAPLACAASATGFRSWMSPNTSGLCTTTQAVSSSMSFARSPARPGSASA